MTPEAIAALADHEAVALGLPRYAEAWLVLRLDHRIDSADFRVTLTIEPQRHAHDWVVYERHGALLTVGEHDYRLNLAQLRLMQAVEIVQQAGSDVRARLEAWPMLVSALHQPNQTHIRTEGQFPRVQLQRVSAMPAHAHTRVGGKLTRAAADAAWGMGPFHRYYLRENAA